MNSGSPAVTKADFGSNDGLLDFVDAQKHFREISISLCEEMSRNRQRGNVVVFSAWRTRYWPAIVLFLGNNLFLNFAPYRIRHGYLRRFCKIHIGRDTTIAAGSYITGDKIFIGDNTVINRFTYLDGRCPLYIGNNVNVSHYSHIQTLTHDPRSPDFACLEGPVAIHDNAWIGARVIILPGVTIGEGAVVGAGSIVTKNVAPYTIVAGNPARAIGVRPRNLRYRTRYFPILDTDIQ